MDPRTFRAYMDCWASRGKYFGHMMGKEEMAVQNHPQQSEGLNPSHTREGAGRERCLVQLRETISSAVLARLRL